MRRTTNEKYDDINFYGYKFVDTSSLVLEGVHHSNPPTVSVTENMQEKVVKPKSEAKG